VIELKSIARINEFKRMYNFCFKRIQTQTLLFLNNGMLKIIEKTSKTI